MANDGRPDIETDLHGDVTGRQEKTKEDIEDGLEDILSHANGELDDMAETCDDDTSNTSPTGTDTTDTDTTPADGPDTEDDTGTAETTPETAPEETTDTETETGEPVDAGESGGETPTAETETTADTSDTSVPGDGTAETVPDDSISDTADTAEPSADETLTELVNELNKTQEGMLDVQQDLASLMQDAIASNERTAQEALDRYETLVGGLLYTLDEKDRRMEGIVEQAIDAADNSEEYNQLIETVLQYADRQMERNQEQLETFTDHMEDQQETYMQAIEQALEIAPEDSQDPAIVMNAMKMVEEAYSDANQTAEQARNDQYQALEMAYQMAVQWMEAQHEDRHSVSDAYELGESIKELLTTDPYNGTPLDLRTNEDREYLLEALPKVDSLMETAQETGVDTRYACHKLESLAKDRYMRRKTTEEVGELLLDMKEDYWPEQ
jgi:hypothetical protein